MHHWVKYCVNRRMKSEVIALTSFVTDGRTPRNFYVPPPQKKNGKKRLEIDLFVEFHSSIFPQRMNNNADIHW